MKAALQRFAARANALAVRERWILTACVCLITWFVIDLLLIGPASKEALTIRQLAEVQHGEVTRVQDELDGLKTGRLPVGDPELIEKLAQIERERNALDVGLREREQQLMTPQGMAELVQSLMRPDGRLQLVALRSLPSAAIVASTPVVDVEPAESSDAASAPTTPAATASGPAAIAVAMERNLYRHGIQLRLRGQYLDVLAYLQELERQSLPLYWGQLEMDVAVWPTLEFLVTINTLSTESAWLKL